MASERLECSDLKLPPWWLILALVLLLTLVGWLQRDRAANLDGPPAVWRAKL